MDEEFTSPKIAPELVARKENYFYYADTVINYFVAFGLYVFWSKYEYVN